MYNLNSDLENGVQQDISEYLKTAKDIQHNIKPSFSRPQLQIPSDKSKIINTELNLSLNDDELMAYIKHIKQTFKKNHEIIKTPLEVLGHKIYKSTSKVSYTKSRGKKINVDANKYLTFQKKIANMLYIYDAYKIGMKQKDIQIELTYYFDKYTFDIATIFELNAIAKEYIDNLKYKEFISGFQ